MSITPDTLVADIATGTPATIAVFQRHQIDFCCGGKIPLRDACRAHDLDPSSLLDELLQAVSPAVDVVDWRTADLSALMDHIQTRYHVPLREELPRLRAMLAKVVSRHGDRHAETLLPLQETFAVLEADLLAHMQKEDTVLFPFIKALESDPDANETTAAWLSGPLRAMEADHDDAGAALTRMRVLTNGYAPPDGACPTFRGLYHGLSQLEADMHLHVHLENNILFPRAATLT
jgi:regulator of cell morphogenesis and NO signaling